ALESNGHHRERTAQALGISRRTLQYKLRKYGLTSR
ncbi:MAG: helix-turn-helix domain-containing protein, partial [Thermodesulfobacteriota bacterium]